MRIKNASAAVLLAVSVLALFAPLGGYDFIDFDDNVYVTDNRHVQAGLSVGNLIWAFTTLDAGFWHPLTWLSLMLDYDLYGSYAGGFHWTNIILHAAAAIFLFLALNRMTGALWRSLLVAALFAFHPLRVEPIAWIAERKDVLATFFWMLTLLAYAAYASQPGMRRYLMIFIPFVLGLMSKPTLVTLPFVLLLLDWWPLRRFHPTPYFNGELSEIKQEDAFPQGEQRAIKSFPETPLSRLLLEKIPFLFLVAAASAVAYMAEKNAGAISTLDLFPLGVRLENAIVSYTVYLWKTIWPVDLAVYYPHPGIRPLMVVVSSGLILAALTFLAGRFWKIRPYGIVGWIWYLGTLTPVIGIVQIGFIAMADRYTYIPQVGLLIVAVWGIPDLLKKVPRKEVVLAVLASSAVIATIAVSRYQMDAWQNSMTVFSQALRVTMNNSKAHHGVGMAYHRQGRSDLAVEHLRESLRIRKEGRAHNDLGVVLMDQGRFVDAERQFRESVRLKPENARYRNNLGASLAEQGRMDEAIPCFQEALRIDPGYASARKNLDLAKGKRPPFQQKMR